MRVETAAEQLFFVTARIDTEDHAGRPGSGTAFLFDFAHGEMHYPFVVTNKHVVSGMASGSITFLKAEKGEVKLGDAQRLAINDWDQAWFGHPSPEIDIAICPFAPIQQHFEAQGWEPFFRSIPSAVVPTTEQLNDLDAIETVTFVGYPNGIWDKSNLLPVARRGTTATPPAIDFEGRPEFIIDASVFGGSSGSPVFLFNQGTFASRDGAVNIGTRFLFLGVVSAVFFRTALSEIIAVPIPTATIPMAQNQEMLDLGIVLKSSTVIQTVEAFLRLRGVEL